MGLYIYKNILKLHNGSIEHEYINNIDGNQFNIFIDFEIQHHLNLEENIIIECEKSKINENIKYNIIIVDDSELTIKLMYKNFKKK